MRPYIVLLLIFFLPSFFLAQNVDSLISILPKSKGKEKAQKLADIGYYLSSSAIDKAIYYGNLSVKEALLTGDSSLLASCINDVSLSYYFKGNFDSCIYLSEKAYAMRLRLGEERNAGASISKAAIGYYEKGKYDVSLQKNLEALRLFKSSNALTEAAKLQNNMGSIYERNNQLDKAMEMYYGSAQYALKVGDIDGYTTAKGNYGIILRKKGKVKESIKIYTTLIDTCRKYCREEYVSSIYQQLGVAERSIGNTQKGLEYYLLAKEIYDRIGSLAGSSIINVNIGNCYADMKQFDKATQFLELGLKQSTEIKSWLWQKNAYFGLYDMERLRGNYQKANEYLELYQQVNDSLYSEKTREGLIELQTRYDLTEKENTILNQKVTIAQSELDISKRNTQLLFLGIVLLLVLVAAAFMVQRSKIKRKEEEAKFQKKVQEERTRISRDLHDNKGAELTIISSQLDIKANGISNKSDQKEIENISDQVRKASALMRDTIWTVSTEKISVDQLGLRIKEFAERTFSAKQVSVHFSNSEKQWNLSPEHTLNLYRICQEVINNASKHSQCKNFYISIFPANEFVIELSDDGIGFNFSEIEKGYGLDNLNTRASEINAKLETSSEQGKGTKYKIVLDKSIFWK
jgi:signal transduction histidine kinase